VTTIPDQRRVISPFPTPTSIITDGDSLTYGTGVSVWSDTYPGQLSVSRGLAYRSQGTTPLGAAVINWGVSGSTVQNMIDFAATQVDLCYQAGAWVVMWGGTNDLFYGASAATVISRISTYCLARKNVGWRVCLVPITSRSDASTPGTFNADRATINTSTKANWRSYADAYADIAADPHIGYDGAETDTNYFTGLVHMIQPGYQIVKNLVNAALPV
jgi:lysophospholipase L1-like esterase